MTKRKADEEASEAAALDTATRLPSPKKPKTAASASIPSSFAAGLFSDAQQELHRTAYTTSEPYKHGVIQPLVADSLLRNVLAEIRGLHFTEKTTDIYRIWQSGDLANLDGLDAAALAALPSLCQLRDALYSAEFRAALSHVTGAGPLSGARTDMAVNIYRPGCYLLCHDDVIGTRRVSYILYLTETWKAEWGGALRLYATEHRTRSNGEPVKVPVSHHEPRHAIPPQWNQLSFFAVQPGESYHDVEEVYVPEPEEEDDGERIRIAISGWYHLPQEHEPGYVAGMEAQLAQTSSLAQLQRSDGEMDTPQPAPIAYPPAASQELSAADLDFLVRYISPQHLTPEAAEWTAGMLGDEGAAVLPCFLNRAMAARVGAAILKEPTVLPHHLRDAAAGAASDSHWQVAGPPHKQRFAFRQPSQLTDVWAELHALFISPAFRTWLQLATGTVLQSVDALLRRFRAGYDYQLAQNYTAPEPRLEATLGLTPGRTQREEGQWWVPPEDEEDEEEEEDDKEEEDGDGDAPDADAAPASNGTIGPVDTSASKGKGRANKPSMNGNHTDAAAVAAAPQPTDAGGEEIYLAGEDDDGDEADAGEGATHSSTSKSKSDPAVYRSSTGTGARASKVGGGGAGAGGAGAEEDGGGEDADADADDDDVLHTNPASWNVLGLVLRDAGVLRAVRYRGRHARAGDGDRWDWTASWAVEGEEEDDEEGESGDGR